MFEAVTGWDPLGSVGTRLDPLGTRWDPLGPVGTRLTRWGPVGDPLGIRWDTFGPVGTRLDPYGKRICLQFHPHAPEICRTSVGNELELCPGGYESSVFSKVNLTPYDAFRCQFGIQFPSPKT